MAMDRSCRRAGAVLLALAVMSGCAIEAVEIRNRQPAQEIERQSRLPGSTYLGWRVFQDRCARCHGSAGQGSPQAPDLLPIVRTMGPRRFADAVLRRYEWNLPVPKSEPDSAAHQALLDELVQRRGPALVMPPWQGQPRVEAHIIDLYAYLSARSDGALGPGQPAP
ncbi:c-type cytochrome [Caldimonas sp. KR1-144]|uniref:c-type cytochrome n=1 Tax=Caldimonas sp. KR1-144 TaxID=3400911 RepID=UPI003C05BC95